MYRKRSFFTQDSSAEEQPKRAKYSDCIQSIVTLSHDTPQTDDIYRYLATQQPKLLWSIDLVDICVLSTQEFEGIASITSELTLEAEGIFFRGMSFAIFKNCNIPVYLDATDFIFCFSLILTDTEQSLAAISHLQIENIDIEQFAKHDWPKIFTFFKERYKFSENTQFSILYGVKNSYSGNIKITDDMSVEDNDPPGKLIANILNIQDCQPFKECAIYAINTKDGAITVLEQEFGCSDYSDLEATDSTVSADEEEEQSENYFTPTH